MDKSEVEKADTATQVLDVAERLAQVRGFNAFSYADIAGELKITTAALHYHFTGKSELGKALIDRYAWRFGEALAAIESSVADAPARLDAYAELYAGVLRDGRMCLCGMFAAEYETLPAAMQESIVRFFNENETWLARVVKLGRDAGAFEFPGTPREMARTIVSTLEGAMLLARTFGDVRRFETVARQLLGGLRVSSGKLSRPPSIPSLK